jgi:hypothetical protein
VEILASPLLRVARIVPFRVVPWGRDMRAGGGLGTAAVRGADD